MDIRKFSGKLILGVLFCLVLALLPGMTMTAQAQTHKHDDITFTAWNNSNGLPTQPGNYYLNTDVKQGASNAWKPQDGVHLCLNGHTITREFSSGYSNMVISVLNGRSFSLYDCKGNGKITQASGNIGSGVYVNGTFTMYGGTITGNNNEKGSNNGSGVHVSDTGTFTMKGGSISGNKTENNGGGVWVKGTFNMEGGVIENNTIDGDYSGYGAGVYNEGTFNISGMPKITGNTAGTEGNKKADNVYLKNLKKINVGSGFKPSAPIGVSMYEKTGVFTTGANYTDDKAAQAHFASDNTIYGVLANASGQAEIGIPVTHYNLWVGGVEVTSAKLSDTGWSFDPDTNTLSLNGFSYTGNGSKGNNQDSRAPYGAIFYSGSTPLTISLTGENTAACESYTKNAGIYVSSIAPLTITGTGTLNATGQTGSNIETYGIYGSNIMITGGTVNAAGGNTSNSQSAGIFGSDVSISGGTVNATGGNTTNTWSAGIRGASSVTIGTGATVKAVGGNGVYSFGIHAGTNIVVTIESDVASVICEGTDGTSKTLGINGKVKNAVVGMGWTTEQTIKTIDIPSEGRNLDFEKVQFPGGKKVTISDSVVNGTISGGGFYGAGDTVTLTVTPAAGYRLKTDSLIASYKIDEDTGEIINLVQDTTDTSKYTFKMPDYDVTVSAVFEVDPALAAASITREDVTTNYLTLKEALDAASKGDTVMVLKTIEESESSMDATISGERAITIDLNGQKVEFGTIYTQADLTISDSSSNGGGKLTAVIDNANVNGAKTLTIKDNTDVTFNGTQWMANYVTVQDKASLTLSPSNSISLSGGNGEFTLNIIGKDAKIELVYTRISGYNEYLVQSQMQQYAPGGQTVVVDGFTPNTMTLRNYPSYTVTYKVDTTDTTISGDVPTDWKSPYKTGDTVKVLGNTGTNPLTKTGHLLVGWTKTADGTGDIYVPGSVNGSFTMGSEDVTLYAKWDAAEASVTSGTTTVYYRTLREALDTAAVSGDIVTVLKDVAIDSTLYVREKTVTLDLNGHTLTNTGTSMRTLKLENGAALTIKDSAGGGTITGCSGDVAPIGSDSDAAITVTLESGTIQTSSSNGFSVGAGSTINLQGGKIECTSDSQVLRTSSAVAVNNNCTVNWSGTEISTAAGSAVYGYPTAKVVVTDGSFVTSSGKYAIAGPSVQLDSAAPLGGKGIALVKDSPLGASYVKVTNELNHSNPVGILLTDLLMKESYTGKFTTGYRTSGNAPENVAKFFGSDDKKYAVGLNDAGEAILGYTVTVDNTIQHGGVKVTGVNVTSERDPLVFVPGEPVMLTLAPHTGYQLKKDTLIYSYVTGEIGSIAIPDQDPNDPSKYTFTMPGANVTVRAEFEPIEYMITYNGLLPTDTVEPANPEKYTIVSADITLTSPQRTGYNFTGWTYTGQTEPTTNVTIQTGSTGNLEYTANWSAKAYTVIFDKNAADAQGEMTGQSFTYDAAAVKLTKNAFTRPGYYFTGWNTNAEGTGDSYYDEQEVQNLTTEAEITLYAQWDQTRVHIVKVDGDNRLSGAVFRLKETQSGTQFGQDLTTDNGEVFFTGVTVGVNYTLQEVTPPAGYYYPLDQDITFELNSENMITITAAGMEDVLIDNMIIVPNQQTKVSILKVDTKTGSALANVQLQILDANQSVKASWTSADQARVIEGLLNVGETYTIHEVSPLTGYAAADDITFTIQSNGTIQTEADENEQGALLVKNPPVYTVSFNANGYGTAPENKLNVVYNTTITAPTAPTETGYTFGGWYKEAACTNEWNFATDTVTYNITLYAKWTINSHKVSYEVTGTVPAGAPTAPAETTVNYGTEVTVADALTLEGYTFSGWSTSDVTVSDGKITMPDKDVKFTGSWTVNEHKVSYEVTGTVPAGAPTAPEETTINYGTEVTVDTGLTLEGYTFSGWSTTDVTVSDGKITMPDKDVKFTGSWTINEHKVSYEVTGTVPAGAPGAPAETTVNFGTEVTVADALTLEGYTFSGWSTTDATVSDGKITMPDKDVKFTGSWTVNEHKVSYEVTGTVPAGAPTAPAETTVNYGTEVTVADALTLEGYTFSGWSTTDATVSDGKITMPDKEVKFTGSWTINGHKVSYEVTGTIPAGAPAAPAETTADFGTEVTVAAGLTLEGYTFSGWSTTDATVSDGKITMPDKDVKFTGSWTVNGHKVSYEVTGTIPEGAPGAPAETIADFGTEVTVAAGLTLEGYTFSGWTTSDAAVSEGKFTMPDGDVKFTGSWTINTYTVTWKNWDGTVLETDEDVPYGTTPSYDGVTPVRPADEDYTYTFIGWDPEIVKVTADAVYTAAYSNETILYTVKVIPGANMTKTAASAAEEQRVNKGSAISAVVYTAGADYYFPADYAVDTVKGISVTRDSDTQITVSGTPAADTVITVITLKDPATRASNTVADPKITLDEGTYTEPQTITITGETEGAVIWYTTDGSDPSDPASNRKQYTGEFVITETSTIRAYAEKDGMFPSKVFTHVITIELPPETWEINVDIHNFSNTGAKGVPGDVPRTEITLTIQIIEKESGEVVSTATGVKFDVMGGPNTAKISLENVEFNHKVEDLSEAKYKAVVRVSPSKVSGVAPMNQVYTLTNEAWPGGRELITIYLKWDDGKRSEPERIKVYALPEDEIGAYTILKDGTKEYLVFHTYDICLRWLGSDELCRGYERCFHKESPYENPFVTATGVIGEIVN